MQEGAAFYQPNEVIGTYMFGSSENLNVQQIPSTISILGAEDAYSLAYSGWKM
jgi:hypothetical protein